jgi:chromatin-remodeling ATPase INO80
MQNQKLPGRVAYVSNLQPSAQLLKHTSQTSLRKQAAKAKAGLTISPSGETSEPDIVIEQPLRPLTDEEMRLLSSDLEDCEEIWRGGMREYESETQQRRNQVADWFETSEMVYNG